MQNTENTLPIINNTHNDNTTNRLWSFVYYVLIEYRCTISFKSFAGDDKYSEHVVFYVSKDSKDLDQVINIINQEWQPLVNSTGASNTAPDFHVSICIHEGIHKYIPTGDLQHAVLHSRIERLRKAGQLPEVSETIQ